MFPCFISYRLAFESAQRIKVTTLHILPQFPPAWSSAPLFSPVLTYPQLHSVTNHPPQYLVSRLVFSFADTSKP